MPHHYPRHVAGRWTVCDTRHGCATPWPATWWRRPRESLDKLRNRRAAGEWTLSWTHFDTEQTQAFKGWSLLLFGPRIARVKGQVKVAGEPGPAPYADVRLDVVGLPASFGERLIAFNHKNGQFEIAYLPGLRIDILASKPGFVQAGIDDLDSPAHPRGFRDHLEGFLASGPGSDDLTITLLPKRHTTAAGPAVALTDLPESSPYRLIQGRSFVRLWR